ncbi:RNA methyltransferase [Candidatus Nanosalina sp. VS9-1]|uniref:RNA methyltransferase n=1 Tax=Candidatus Nanosalina sp. VS9-1 TaxID=3388566 RepID=UPI0039E0A37B
MRSAVIVEPEIPENTGFIARLCANFGFQLRVVNPEFNLEEARKTASKAQDKLRNAKIYDTVEEAVDDLNFVVGTKPGKGTSLENFQPREDTSIMIGRESSGLSNKELELCDAVIHVETGEYSSINQSHAAAIIMHSFSVGAKKASNKSGDNQVLEKFIQIPLLRKLLKQANPSQDELNSLIGQMKEEGYFD